MSKPNGRLLLAALWTHVLASSVVDDAMESAFDSYFRVYAPSKLTGLLESAGFSTVENSHARMRGLPNVCSLDDAPLKPRCLGASAASV